MNQPSIQTLANKNPKCKPTHIADIVPGRVESIAKALLTQKPIMYPLEEKTGLRKRLNGFEYDEWLECQS